MLCWRCCVYSCVDALCRPEIRDNILSGLDDWLEMFATPISSVLVPPMTIAVLAGECTGTVLARVFEASSGPVRPGRRPLSWRDLLQPPLQTRGLYAVGSVLVDSSAD